MLTSPPQARASNAQSQLGKYLAGQGGSPDVGIYCSDDQMLSTTTPDGMTVLEGTWSTTPASWLMDIGDSYPAGAEQLSLTAHIRALNLDEPYVTTHP